MANAEIREAHASLLSLAVMDALIMLAKALSPISRFRKSPIGDSKPATDCPAPIGSMLDVCQIFVKTDAQAMRE
ncbi:hypothetical protein [Sandarakinorhabdus sp. AAP62]|uniref:hypothetical protein n=1 Tax=Sandarakinorhabdus sp. AAP62 TaxID=1248916 RepID=UPI0002E38EB6|nr:hypothetical protein [Sandarakinorhabdus sp. AAP62]